MKLTKDRVLVEEIVKEEKSDQGIFLVAKNRNYTAAKEGKVLEVGPEVKEVSVDDKVFFVPNTGYDIDGTDPIQRILKEEDILAII